MEIKIEIDEVGDKKKDNCHGEQHHYSVILLSVRGTSIPQNCGPDTATDIQYFGTT